MTTEIKNRIETIVKKYRDYVKANCREDSHPIWTSEDGDMEYVMIPDPIDSAADVQLIATLYNTVAEKDADEEIKKALSDYSKCYKPEALSDEEFGFLHDHYIDVIKYVYNNRSWLNSAESKYLDNSNEYIQFSQHIIEELKQGKEPSSVFLPYASLDTALLFPKSTNIYGFCKDATPEFDNDEDWALMQIYLQAEGYHSEIKPNFFTPDVKYDFICASITTLDKNILEVFKLLSDKGRMSLVVNDFDLAEQQKIYDFVNRNHSLKSVIYRKFESDSLWGGDLGFLFISIDCQGVDSVLMRYDNIDKECRVDYKDLVSNMLLPTYYLTPKPKIGIPLSKIADLVTDKNAGSLTDLAEVIDVLETKFHKIVSPVNNSHHVSDYRKDEKDWALSPIKQPCVLFRGIDDAYGLKVVKEIPEFGYATKGGYAQFVPKDGYDLYYLAATLLRPEVKSQIMGFCDGIALGYYIEHFLDYILVPDFSPEERAEFVSAIAIQAIADSTDEMNKQKEDYERGVRMRKHAMSQSLTAIDSTFKVLIRHFKKTGELKSCDCISKITRRTVDEALDYIDRTMPKVMKLTKQLANVKYDFGDSEWFNLSEFIDSYIMDNKVSQNNYKLCFSGKKSKGDLIYFPKKALERVLDNIIHNAESHGFIDEQRTDYCIDLSLEKRDGKVSIIVKNNGAPIPKGIDNSNIFDYGKSSSLDVNDHCGIGCHVIKYILERYDGEVCVMSTPNETFTVSYVISLNNIEQENGK